MEARRWIELGKLRAEPVDPWLPPRRGRSAHRLVPKTTALVKRASPIWVGAPVSPGVERISSRDVAHRQRAGPARCPAMATYTFQSW